MPSLEHKLKIELTHGSTAIEGNTLTLRETQLLIDAGIAPQGSKRLREIYETVNHHKAVLLVQDLVREGKECGESENCFAGAWKARWISIWRGDNISWECREIADVL